MATFGLWQELTDREIEILQHLAEGRSNKQIADKLRITVRTVKFHTHNLYEKLNVNSRAEAIVWIWRHQEDLALDNNGNNLYRSTG